MKMAIATATIATTEIITDVSDVHYKMQLTGEIGPASIGMANGVKAISFLVCASLSFAYSSVFTKFT
jgi:hypothetical protein